MSLYSDVFIVNIEQIHTLFLVSLLLILIEFHSNVDSIFVWVCICWKKGTFLTNELADALLTTLFDEGSMFFQTPHQNFKIFDYYEEEIL